MPRNLHDLSCDVTVNRVYNEKHEDLENNAQPELRKTAADIQIRKN